VIAALRERTGNMAAGPVFWTPTIEGLFNFPYMVGNHEHVDGMDWHEGLPPEIVADIRRSITHPERISYFQQTPQRWPTLKRKFQQLRESGAMLLIGTDSGIPMKFHSGSTWNELEVWVNQLGVPPVDAIRAATYWPAVAMKADKDYGTVTEGKYADIIAVKGDALKHINLLQRVDLVIKHGKQVK
jgi:predicted amidohydrolase YtcJ